MNGFTTMIYTMQFLLWMENVNAYLSSIQGQNSKRFKRDEMALGPVNTEYCFRILEPSEFGYWRKIEFSDFFDNPSTNFRCTWILQTSMDKKIQISIKRLNFGTDTRGSAISCQGNFIELTDNGFQRGKFCHREVPGDYVAEGDTLQVDVRGDYRLVKILKSEKEPFSISYRSIPNSEQSGGRPHSQDIVYEDEMMRMNPTPFSIKDIPKITPGRTFEDELREEGDLGMPLGGIIGIISACLLFIILIIAIILYRKKRKEKKEAVNLAESSSGSSYSSNKAIPIAEIQGRYYDDLPTRIKISSSESSRQRSYEDTDYTQIPRSKKIHNQHPDYDAYHPITPPRPGRAHAYNYGEVNNGFSKEIEDRRPPKSNRTASRQARGGAAPTNVRPMTRTTSKNATNPNRVVPSGSYPHPSDAPHPKMRSSNQMYGRR